MVFRFSVKCIEVNLLARNRLFRQDIPVELNCFKTAGRDAKLIPIQRLQAQFFCIELDYPNIDPSFSTVVRQAESGS
jgi:hypothetical protein